METFESLADQIKYMLSEQFEALTSDEDGDEAVGDLADFYVELAQIIKCATAIQNDIIEFVPEVKESI
jgi:hypothetical protein